MMAASGSRGGMGGGVSQNRLQFEGQVSAGWVGQCWGGCPTEAADEGSGDLSMRRVSRTKDATGVSRASEYDILL